MFYRDNYYTTDVHTYEVKGITQMLLEPYSILSISLTSYVNACGTADPQEKNLSTRHDPFYIFQ